MTGGILTVLLFAASVVPAGERQYLWPEGGMPYAQPHQIAAPLDVATAKGFDADRHRAPYLEWHEAPVSNRTDACVILISGGSYNSWCDVKLVKEWRRNFTAMGIRCVSLVYRTPRPKKLPIYSSAWADGQRAVRLVRSRAKELGFEPENIGAVGMSAGGHLTVMLSANSLTPAYARTDALDDVPAHLNWAVANAPAYATTDGEAGTEASRGGDGVDVAVSPAFRFDGKTCPMCLTHGGNDPYTPMGSTRIYRELRKRKVPAEIHLYADKGHGAFGFGRVAEFLRQLEVTGKLGKEEYMAVYSGRHTGRRVKFDLWPEGKMPYVQTNQTYRPYVEIFMPRELKTKAVQVVFPGGGYMHCSTNSEGKAVAELFNAKGMAAAVVVYRVPRPLGGLAKHVTAWADAQRAIRIVRREAASLGLDGGRVGVMGFSAGGHLTLMCATASRSRAYRPIDKLDSESVEVQWALPTYPAYALTDGESRPNSGGGNWDDARLVPEFAFDLSTPPMCFQHGDSDVWAAMNSVKAWEQLRRMGIQSDLHTFAKRGHCFQFRSSPGTGSRNWFERHWDFLDAKGFVR
jgi:acetyl esterase/lipase